MRFTLPGPQRQGPGTGSGAVGAAARSVRANHRTAPLVQRALTRACQRFYPTRAAEGPLWVGSPRAWCTRRKARRLCRAAGHFAACGPPTAHCQARRRCVRSCAPQPATGSAPQRVRVNTCPPPHPPPTPEARARAATARLKAQQRTCACDGLARCCSFRRSRCLLPRGSRPLRAPQQGKVTHSARVAGGRQLRGADRRDTVAVRGRES